MIVLSATAMASSVPAAESETEALAPARREQLIHLVRHDCGSCHGMTLQGGLGPALSKEALAQRPQAFLQQAILYGVPGTAMPPWRGILSEQDADWIAQELRKGFP
jgi:cytochrome c55X